MSTVVKNVGPVFLNTNGLPETKNIGNRGDQGTVRVVLRGIEYVWGPNESKTLPDDIAAEAVAASSSRLRVADSRDGMAQRSNASVSYSAF